jgi:hypothetical protein
MLGILFALQATYFTATLKWEDQKTVGLSYYGLAVGDRRQFKAALRRRARILRPMLWLTGRLARLNLETARFQYRGVSGPPGSSSRERFAKAEAYRPRAEDVFVVTQMRSGTTWMQHLVYQVVNRGTGDLVETGTSLYAVSPWLEGRKSVGVDQAPALGAERPARIIKTHLPAQLCPSSPAARFIYVARHPVACFASCVDFVITNLGAMVPPPLVAFEKWFCSPELMWWGTWTDHLRGWWTRAERDGNVLWVHFEDLSRDLPAVVRRVTEFLGVAPLTAGELARVAERCSFDYMRHHRETFEMQPPHLLQTDADWFVRGGADRHQDVPPEVGRRILAWAGRELEGSAFPLADVYPDVAAARTGS